MDRQLEDLHERTARLRALIVYTVPSTMVFLALWLPMFAEDGREGSSAPPGGARQIGLVRLVVDGGEGDRAGLQAVAAAVVILFLTACVALSLLSVERPDGLARLLQPFVAATTFFAVLALWAVSQAPVTGGSGDDAAWSPLGRILLLMVLPIWFLVARTRDRAVPDRLQPGDGITPRLF